MPSPRLISARWLQNHGIELCYSSGEPRWVPPDGALTVGQASRLLGILPLTIYRLSARGILRFRDRAGVATVSLAELRRLGKSGNGRPKS